MKELYIHIGAHKTGTTSVQMGFSGNRAALRAAGVTFPQCNWYHFSQHRIAFALFGGKVPKTGEILDLAREMAALNAAISAAKTPKVLISSEVLFARTPAQIAALRQGLDIKRVKIIAFTRRPDDFLLSIYNQKTKEPRNDFKLPLSHYIEGPRYLAPDMQTKLCIENWAQVFGHENILLCRYEDQPPILRICDILGLPRAAFSNVAQLNPSLPGAVVELMRLSKQAGVAPATRIKLFKQAVHSFAGYPKASLTAAERRRILVKFEPEYEDLFSSFGMDNPYRVAAIPPDEDLPEAQASGRDVSKDDFLKLLSQIIEKPKTLW